MDNPIRHRLGGFRPDALAFVSKASQAVNLNATERTILPVPASAQHAFSLYAFAIFLVLTPERAALELPGRAGVASVDRYLECKGEWMHFVVILGRDISDSNCQLGAW